ncbi:MAG TPA: hypothetical protein VG965_03495 [Patescibacteria group bacterium]|nr:hypothetical protein [Patescibacteria group bacterium]
MIKKILAILFLVIFGIVMYLATLRGVWGDARPGTKNITDSTMPFESSHERSPFATTLSLMDNHRFQLSKNLADFASPDVGIYHGKFYSYFPPAVSVWIIPFYEFGHKYNLAQVAAYFSMSLFSIGSLVLIYLISKDTLRLSQGVSIFNSIVFGFASTAWSYSATIYQHGMTVFLLLLAFYSAWKFSISKRSAFLWAIPVWVSYGISAFVDYPNVVLLAPVMVYFVLKATEVLDRGDKYGFKIKLSIVFSSVFLFALVFLHAYYNQVTFGNWKTLSNILPRYDASAATTQGKTTQQLEQINQKTSSFELLSEDRIISGAYELLIAQDKGIFIFSPILLVSLLGIIYALKKTTFEINTLIALAVVNIFFYASFSDPWGGWAYGPRYIIPAMASLSFFVGIAIEHFPKKWLMRVLVFVLFAASSGISLLGSLTTNLVPPKVEAVYLKMKYGYAFNIDYLSRGQTGSFMYNNFFRQNWSLLQYYEFILIILVVLAFILLFIFPLFKGEKVEGNFKWK